MDAQGSQSIHQTNISSPHWLCSATLPWKLSACPATGNKCVSDALKTLHPKHTHTHTATQKCHGIKSGHGLGPSTTLNCGALLRQTMQSCCPCFGPRFAGTILFWLFLNFILAGVSFPSSTLLRRACVGSHQGIVLADSRVKILGVCSSPISLSRGVGPCVKPNTHPIPRVSDTLALSLAAASAAREQTHVKHQVHSYLP